MRRKPRVFFDTNVIFSGLYREGGPPAELLDSYAANKLTLVVCGQVLEELVRTIEEKIPQALPALYLLLSSTPPEIVADPGAEEVTRWAQIIHQEDAPILAAAIAAEVDYLVTGNTKHFIADPEVARKSGLTIVTPAQLVDVLEWQGMSG
jgi:putative PIN family toxin of toxin-antitoxin system